MGTNLVIVFTCLIVAIISYIKLIEPNVKGWYSLFVIAIYAAAIFIGLHHARIFGDTLEARFDILEQKSATSGPVEAGEESTSPQIKEE